MDPIRILVADDDPGMRVLLTGIVQKTGDFDLVGTAGDGDELMLLYEQQKPQAVIMDVEMPGKTGIECARLIQDKDPLCIIVFVTAHEEYMGDAFKVYAFDYLLKPFEVDRAIRTLDMVAKRIRGSLPPEERKPAKVSHGTGTKLMLKSREGVSFVNVTDILLVQREDRQTVLYAEGGRRFVTGDSLSDLEEKLDPVIFFRSHKSYIINLEHIDTITPYGRWTYAVTLEGIKQDALITAEKYDELKERFGYKD
ncbi:MAG: response regulator transcription factor [Clostridia bacterium]|nr:response regulator transcription factor [Clostridia bacterium]